MLMFTALPVMQATQQWSLSLPNHYNMAFSYYYFTAFLMFLYIPRESMTTVLGYSNVGLGGSEVPLLISPSLPSPPQYFHSSMVT